MENNNKENNNKGLEIYPINYEDNYMIVEFDFKQAYVMADEIYSLLDFYHLYDDEEDKNILIEEIEEKTKNLREYIFNFIYYK